MNKLKNYIIIALLISLIGLFFFFRIKVKDLENKLDSGEQERKEQLQKVRDSAYRTIVKTVYESKIKIDSISKLKDKIKYIPYEKLLYADRDLDSALDTIAEYRYNP